MAVTTFAAIDVGSHETTLRIYEISKRNGIHELDYVHHTSRLGYETYSTRHVSLGSGEAAHQFPDKNIEQLRAALPLL